MSEILLAPAIAKIEILEAEYNRLELACIEAFKRLRKFEHDKMKKYAIQLDGGLFMRKMDPKEYHEYLRLQIEVDKKAQVSLAAFMRLKKLKGFN